MIKARHFITTVNEDGQKIQYSKGDTLELDPKEEIRLIDLGAAEEIEVEEPSDGKVLGKRSSANDKASKEKSSETPDNNDDEDESDKGPEGGKEDEPDENANTQDTAFNVNPDEVMKAPEKAVHKKAGK